MKILVIGSGGREHALAWKLSRSPRVHKVFVAPGNPGTAREPGVENVAISAIPALIDFVRAEQIALTVVGPEAPLAAGVVGWVWSPIKFQADMGILLTFMFLWNMVGALVLIPALSHFLLNPRQTKSALPADGALPL